MNPRTQITKGWRRSWNNTAWAGPYDMLKTFRNGDCWPVCCVAEASLPGGTIGVWQRSLIEKAIDLCKLRRVSDMAMDQLIFLRTRNPAVVGKRGHGWYNDCGKRDRE